MGDKKDYVERYPIIEGYLSDNVFYKDMKHEKPVEERSNTRYFDKSTGKMFRWSWSKRKYVDFIYSSHLLPVGSSNNIPTKYRQINVDENDFILTGTVTGAFTCEHNRVIYTGILVNDSIFRIRKLDLLSGKFSYVCDIPKTVIGNYYIGCMLVDDNYIYITSSAYESYQTIYRITIENLNIDTFVSSSRKFQCQGKMEWYDDKTIMLASRYGFILFDTVKQKFSYIEKSTNYGNRYDFSIGEKILLSHANSNTTSVVKYDIENDTFSTITLPNSNISMSCYSEGKFYIVQTNYLHIYDEIDGSMESFSIPWKNPKMINYTNGILFVTQRESKILYIYDIKNNIYRTIILPWTITNDTTDGVLRSTAIKGYYFLPYLTLCIIDYSESTKYNLGYKFNQYAFIFNKREEAKFEYDERFVEFKDSHATIHDGTISVPVEVIDDANHIKKAHMNKSDYTKMKSISYLYSSTNDETE